jgi:hypothetical protein
MVSKVILLLSHNEDHKIWLSLLYKFLSFPFLEILCCEAPGEYGGIIISRKGTLTWEVSPV